VEIDAMKKKRLDQEEARLRRQLLRTMIAHLKDCKRMLINSLEVRGAR
jgi:hypothetical protein